MFNVEFKRFLTRVINEKQLESATGKSKSSIYRYAEDPMDEDKNRRGVSMPVDFLIQVVINPKLKKEKRRKLLEFLCESCGEELKEKSIENPEQNIDKQAKQLEVFKSVFSVKNWQALRDNKISPEEATELIPLADDVREHLTKYICSLRKIINEVRK